MVTDFLLICLGLILFLLICFALKLLYRFYYYGDFSIGAFDEEKRNENEKKTKVDSSK